MTFNYGGDQKRRTTTEGSNTTWYNWDGWSVLNEENGSGTLQKTYLGGLAEIVGSTSSYYVTDNLGYTGHAWDATASLYFAPYRFYNPQIARWTTRDLMGRVEGPNMYAYVSEQPTQRTDSLGLFSLASMSWDINFTFGFGPAASGLARSACCDDKGRRWVMWTYKHCVGVWIGGSAAVHNIQGYEGAQCPYNYTGWFTEGGLPLAGPVTLDWEIGHVPPEDPQMVGLGLGAGVGAGAGWCYYRVLSRSEKRDECCD